MCFSSKEKKKIQENLLHFLAIAKPEDKLKKIVELWANYDSYSKSDRVLIDKIVELVGVGSGEN